MRCGSFLGGVTRSLNISYLKAIPIGTLPPLAPYFGSHPLLTDSSNQGTTIRLHSEVLQVGRTMAMIRGTMTSQDGKTIFCTCEHHKVSVPTRKAHLLHRVPWDDLWDKDGNVEGKSKL
jgi:acyl-coenzyme A thioesterase 13